MRQEQKHKKISYVNESSSLPCTYFSRLLPAKISLARESTWRMESVYVCVRATGASQRELWLMNENESLLCAEGRIFTLVPSATPPPAVVNLDFRQRDDPVSMIQTDRWWTSTSFFFLLLVRVLFLWKFGQPPSHFLVSAPSCCFLERRLEG